MANCHDLFLLFDETIRPNSTQVASLRTSRDALRKKVAEKLKEKGFSIKHHQQGSFAMGTMITPTDDDYDIDDGAYLQVESEPSETTATIHTWIVAAAKDHTSIDPIDKNPCVRVLFKDGYHVDLVTYYQIEGDASMLAHKSKGWIVSDPKQFMKWFDNESDDNGQLKRIIRYLKGWKGQLSQTMPSGLILTILATYNFKSDARDDIAFLNTLKAIKAQLEISFNCLRPTTPYEDLFADYSETNQTYFVERLNSLIENGDKAILESSKNKASKKWRRHFGADNFPLGEDLQDVSEARKFSNPAFISHEARSA